MRCSLLVVVTTKDKENFSKIKAFSFIKKYFRDVDISVNASDLRVPAASLQDPW